MPENLQNDAPATRAKLLGSTFGQRRADIFQRLQNSAQQIKQQFEGRRELASEKDDAVSEFCLALEETFSYGLRSQHANVVVTAASLFQNMQEIVTSGIVGGQDSRVNSNNNDDTSFWDFCQTHLTTHERERYNKLKHIWTKSGRGRAFIRSALNENSLHRYVLTWLSDDQVLNRFYTPWSLLLNEEAVKQLPEIIASLNGVLFALNVDTTELNAPQRRIDSPVAAARKSEPIIYAPEPVPVNAATQATKSKSKRRVNAIERPIVSANSTEDLLGALKPKESLEVQQLESRQIVEAQMQFVQEEGVYTTPIDPIEPELEFLKTPLPDTPLNEATNNSSTSSNNTDHELLYEDRSDTSSQYSKSSSSANYASNAAKQTALEEQVRTLNERCALLETRVAELSLQNRQLVRRLTIQFNESGIDPSSSLCANFLITIPHVKLVKTQRSTHYTYEIHITMRQRLEHWLLHRRYNEFYKLHKSLLRTHPAVSNVEFPPKKHFGNMNLVFVEERRQQLQIYLLNLVETLPQVEMCKSKAELQRVFPFFRER